MRHQVSDEVGDCQALPVAGRSLDDNDAVLGKRVDDLALGGIGGERIDDLFDVACVELGALLGRWRAKQHRQRPVVADNSVGLLGDRLQVVKQVGRRAVGQEEHAAVVEGELSLVAAFACAAQRRPRRKEAGGLSGLDGREYAGDGCQELVHALGLEASGQDGLGVDAEPNNLGDVVGLDRLAPHGGVEARWFVGGRDDDLALVGGLQRDALHEQRRKHGLGLRAADLR